MKKLILLILLCLVPVVGWAGGQETNINAKVVDDPVAAIRAALPEYSSITVETDAHPWFRFPGKGIAIHITDTRAALPDPSHNGVLFIMPRDYKDDLIPRTEEGKRLLPDLSPPALIAITTDAKIYLWEAELIKDILLKAVTQVEKQPLQLTIKSDKEVYEVGEHVNVAVSFRNQSSDRITITYHPDEFFCSGWKVNDLIGYLLPVPAKFNNDKIITKTMPPGGVFSDTVDLNNNKNNLECPKIDAYPPGFFNRPGKYNISFSGKIKISLKDDDYKNYTVTSNIITIEVVEKKGISKEEALKLVQNFIKEHKISVIDINVPLGIKEFSRINKDDSWMIHYEYRRDYLADPPPWHVFIVDKKSGEIRSIGLR